MKTTSSYLDSHFNESFTIHEVGMKLIPEHHSKIRLRLESLERRTPAISLIHLRFTKKENGVRGELSIVGAGRSFRSEVRGENPWEIYKSLEREIDKQLIRWKKTRSLDKYVGLPISERQGKLTGGYVV